jgi:hypothetical protein
MKNPQTSVILAALILVLPLPKMYSQAEKLPLLEEPQEQALESIISTNRDIRLRAATRLDDQRRQLVKQLIVILNSTNADSVKLEAVVVLGEYRAVEAIPILVQHFEWDDASPRGGIHALWREEVEDTGYPVDEALDNIGMPAIPALLDKITETDDAEIVGKCVTICQHIEGLEVTRFRLQALLDKETDLKKKERIQSALEALKK